MSATGLEIFDKTLQATNTWLDEIMQTLGPDRHVAWHVLGSVLRTLRDRLPMGLSAHLGGQLPLLIRGLYYDRWQPSDVPQKWRSLEEFTALLAADLHGIRPVNTLDASRAVFQVLNHYVDPGQVAKIRESLPEEVRRIWPESGPLGGEKLSTAA